MPYGAFTVRRPSSIGRVLDAPPNGRDRGVQIRFVSNHEDEYPVLTAQGDFLGHLLDGSRRLMPRCHRRTVAHGSLPAAGSTCRVDGVVYALGPDSSDLNPIQVRAHKLRT